MTLTEFLLARIAEDEAVALKAQRFRYDLPSDAPWERSRLAVEQKAALSSDPHIARFTPARVLAECEKNRRIVALHESWPTLVETPLETETTDDISGYVIRASKQIAWLTTREYVARFGIDPPTAPMLAALALPYADHPDYLPEWKP